MRLRARGPWAGTLVALVAAALPGACGSPRLPEEPAPVPAPAVEADAPEPTWDPWEVVLPDPGPVERDEILGSPMGRHPELRREVARWVAYWEGPGARWFPEYLERMAWFDDTVDSMLVRRSLPLSLRYLPIIESGYSPRATSRARAVGLWQFVAGTAQGLGLSVGPLLDERRDPFKSTDAAGTFLTYLRNRFGSWFLALAAYNAGPQRVQRVLDRHAPLTPPSDSLYWEIRVHLPRETRDFVPKFLGAATVAGNPRLHGFAEPDDTRGFHFEEVTVPDATTLDVVAEAAGVEQEEIQRLNPQVVRGITPRGSETALRVPRGTAARFVDRYARIPPEERVTFVEHRVVSGETLTHIARRYGVPLSDLRAANPGVEPRRLQIGQRLTVPVAPRVGSRRGGNG